MSYKPSYVSGEWKADCDACGKTFKASQLKKRWDGLMVCHSDFEIRQPQDFVRAKADLQAPKWTRPEPSDSFIPVHTPSAVAGYAVAGYAVAGVNLIPDVVPPSTF